MKKIISFENLQGVTLRKEGLTTEEVLSQRRKFGRNVISEDLASPWWLILQETLKDPMVALLVTAGSLFLFLENYSEAITLFTAILPLVGMDLYLHHRTQASTQVLKTQFDRSTNVHRGNQTLEIESEEIVPGDRVLLKTGDYLSADGFFEETDKLLIDESMLTGESLPIKKENFNSELRDAAKAEVAVLTSCLGFAGTRVVRGNGVLRILSTATGTEYGTIVQTLARVPQEKTPLQNDISRLVRILTISGFACCLLLAAVRVYQGKGWLDAILSAAILAVAAMPEEFPLVFSFFLGVGVYRLAKQQALVRRAVTVENIGQVKCICTDKTGTITLGEFQLINIQNSPSVSRDRLLEGARTASEEEPTDPVDVAIAKFYSGSDQAEKILGFPFTEERKKESAISRSLAGDIYCFTKGAPEVVLGLCSLSETEIAYWLEVVALWSGEGEKVIACAEKKLSPSDDLQVEPNTGFKFCGLLGFSDPLRPEVKGAMEYCRDQDIKVLMLTGDHPRTAAAIAEQAGIGGSTLLVLSMEDRGDLNSKGAMAKALDEIESFDVIARCNPLQKLWIVDALKRHYRVIAVTGDGVNDVPALQRADIGIAMGKRGARAAREVAAIVLADDNFATIVKAIREGKQLFKNLNVSFEYLLIMQIPLVLGAALIPLTGYPLLFLPVHLVWMELILHPTALLAFQLPAVKENKASSDGGFFKRRKLILTSIEGLLILAVVIASFVWGIEEQKGEGHARANSIVVLCIASMVFVLRTTLLGTKASAWIFTATFLLTLVLIQVPFFSDKLSLMPLHWVDWTRALLLVLGTSVISFFLRKKFV